MGKKLKMARVLANLKAKDVASACGISKTYYSNLENDKARNPSKELMMKISKVLNQPVDKLFFND